VNDELERVYVDAVVAYLIIIAFAWNNEKVIRSFSG
jgi:hypothetical protein